MVACEEIAFLSIFPAVASFLTEFWGGILYEVTIFVGDISVLPFGVNVMYQDGLFALFLLKNWSPHNRLINGGVGREVCRSPENLLRRLLLFLL